MVNAPARTASPGRFELALVVIVGLVGLLPGIWSYSPVDPWETHYGEVARMMRQTHDYVVTRWPGTNYDGAIDEGFRSKPVLGPWLIAAGMHATGLAADGGYSGEMVHDARTMIALRAPFVACAIAGLTLLWWALARLVSRRVAWLTLLVVGSSPMFCLIARQAIPDMPLCACVMGSVALLLLAIEDGDRPCAPVAMRVVLGLAGGFVVVQAIYYAYYFAVSPVLAVRAPPPSLWLPAVMIGALCLLAQPVWRVVQRPLSIITFHRIDRLLAMAPITTMRQVYLLGAYALVGVSVLDKGPPGLAIAGGVGLGYVVVFGRWRQLLDGAFEIKRGVILMAAICVPWHVAMYLKDGAVFVQQYLLFNVLNRATVGVDSSPGTFEMYTAELGVGMWLWAALVPAAVIAAVVYARMDSRAGRVRALIAIWAAVSFALFALVQTKFHHYILPAVVPLGALVAFWLDDVIARRTRLHPLAAALGAAIALLVCRDLMAEPKRWVEMFVFRYDRPWPSSAPWQIDPSDGFLALGVAAAASIALVATRWRRLGAVSLCATGLAIGGWALHIYMPIAGTHWGMREAIRTYYDQRMIYGEKLAYFGLGELYDDWHAAGDHRSFATHIPEALQVGQPMTVTIEIRAARDDRPAEHGPEQTIALVAKVVAIRDHEVELVLLPGERDRLAPLLANAATGPRGRPAIHDVDADHLVAWELYWRGENFWSAEEIWGQLPEHRSTFLKNANAELGKYLNDRTREPLGRRTFVVTDAGHMPGLRGLLPTERARDSFEVVDTTSNKFSLAAFTL